MLRYKYTHLQLSYTTSSTAKQPHKKSHLRTTTSQHKPRHTRTHRNQHPPYSTHHTQRKNRTHYRVIDPFASLILLPILTSKQPSNERVPTTHTATRTFYTAHHHNRSNESILYHIGGSHIKQGQQSRRNSTT